MCGHESTFLVLPVCPVLSAFHGRLAGDPINAMEATPVQSFGTPMSTARDATNLVLSGLDADIEYDAPIGLRMTWYRVGGTADVLVRPRSVEALSVLLARAQERGVPVRVLGSGANLLVHDDGIDGIVVHLDQPAFREVSTLHRHRANRGGTTSDAGDGLRAMAGAVTERLVIGLAQQGMSGLEMMAGIPSTIGGAVRMNAGGKFGCIGDVVKAVGCLDMAGQPVTYHNDSRQLRFEYRRSSIVEPVILWAELKLEPDDPQRVHDRVKEIFAFKKKSQPMGEHTAGCAFKNPSPGTSAGRLIDEAGLKGFSIGSAYVSTRHANFLCTTDLKTARASDLIALMEHITAAVEQQAGVHLEREVVVWSRKSQPAGHRADS
ncbi:MAG: UDP-N-acetylmuramate dehydrogenase [Planctomycetes bacterium]|nr:UDP-N-acetylmuramate dehydrogenase [Planctomycetota bacterium]